jgi:hypothetical protein
MQHQSITALSLHREHDMNDAVILPEPGKVTLTQVRSVVLPAATAAREVCRLRRDIPAAQELCRKLEAFRKYIQDREGRDLLAWEARETEILIGELLGPAEQTWPGKPNTSPAGEVFYQVDEKDRAKFRLLADHQDFVRQIHADTGLVSRNPLVETVRRMLAAKEAPQDVPSVVKGDFRTAGDAIPDGSAALVLTDPPYAATAAPLYADLGRFAARVLMPGGSLVCYCGQATLPEALDALRPHLRYWWTFALLHKHGGQQLPGKWVLVEWKPVLWLVKERRAGQEYVADVLRGSAPEKAHHEWAQGIEEVQYLIEKLTVPGELVVDPLAGSGAFGRAALALGRRFCGIDLDPDAYEGVAS